jgi:hypothetical protein
MNVRFHRKDHLLNALNDLQQKPSTLIDYLDSNGIHKFTYFSDHIELINNLDTFKINNHYYINEIILNGIHRKPYLDLEKIYPDEQTYLANKENILRNLRKDIITVFDKQYNEVLTKKDIQFLESSGKVDTRFKISFHIIISPMDRTLCYTNNKFTESSAFHLYTSLISLNEDYTELLDAQVYNKDCTFRIIGSAKNLTDHRTLKPLGSTNKLRYMLTYIDPTHEVTVLKTPLIEQSTKSKKIIKYKQVPQTDISKSILKLVLPYHPTAFYHGIFQEMFHGFNYTNRKEQCPISGIIHDGTNGFYVCETDRGYYLKCHSGKCVGSKHLGYVDDSSNFLDNAIQINQRYLITKGNIDQKPNEPTKELIIKWLDTDIKVFAIKSAMGTGKTTMIHKILDYKQFNKILWVTHRQTLTKQIYGNFKESGFKNYMDLDGCLYSHDRLIIQIDSLMRIVKKDPNLIFKRYDLIIIDEIEGCLNHFNSPFLGKFEHTPRDIFNFLLKLINFSSKLLVLDADIGMRTNLFINNFDKRTGSNNEISNESIVVNNNYMPIKKIFTITNSISNFDSKLFQDITENKNICIVSMSANALERIVTELVKLKVKYVMHTSRTDDKLKDELEDVNNFWIDYQVVLYSPTIESGVDFNSKHFYKIYCILKNGQMTCSQRGFLQMVGRIRQIADPNILCFYDGITKTNSLIYTFDDVLSYCRYYEEINGKKIIQDAQFEEIITDDQVQLVRKNSPISLFDFINIYNEVEQLNKHPNIFITILNSLIQKAGHELKFDISEPEIQSSKSDIKDKLISINEKEFNLSELMIKQSKNQLNENEKLALKKIFFIKTFGITDSSHTEEMTEFIDKYFGKESLIKKFEKFFGYSSMIDQYLDSLSGAKEKVRHIIINDFIDRFGGFDITMTHTEYNSAISDITTNSMYFKNEANNRSLFFKAKGNFKAINSTNHVYYVRTIQMILSSYGIVLKQGKQIRIGTKRVYEYSLSVDKQIKDIVDYKHGKIKRVPDYPHIFKPRKTYTDILKLF